LFAYDWDNCIILHPYNNEPSIFVSSREKWLKDGKAGERNQELQVYLPMPDSDKLTSGVMPDAGKEWYNECINHPKWPLK
jgi:hypothetical protein